MSNYNLEQMTIRVIVGPNFRRYNILTLPMIASKLDKIVVQQHLKRNILQDQDRRYIWLYTTGALNAMSSCHQTQSYTEILKRCNQDFPNPNFRQIKLDLNRTFQDEPYYKEPRMIQAIENVLQAYSVRNPTIGYCQGFNFIVGRLLLVVNEEEAFWMFCMIIETIMPLDYYSNLVGALIDQKVFNDLFEEKFPEVFDHLYSLGCDPSLITFQWFACFFSYNVPFQTLIRIWDFFFLKGIKILFRVSLGIIDKIKLDLLKTNDFQEIFKILDQFPLKLNNFEILMQSASRSNFKISTKQINQMRAEKREGVIEEIQNIQTELKDSINSNINRVKFLNKFYLYNGIAKQMDQKIKGFDINKTEHIEKLTCDQRWPVCLFDFTYKNKVPEYFAIRVHQSSYKILPHYFKSNDDQSLSDSQFMFQSQIQQSYSQIDSEEELLKNGLNSDFLEESDRESLGNTPPQIGREDYLHNHNSIQFSQDFDDRNLLIERNSHFCSKRLISRFKHLIRKNDIDLYTSNHLNFKINNEPEGIKNIEKFISSINTIYEKNNQLQNLLRCLKRSNSEFTKIVPVSRTRTNSNEAEEQFKSIKLINKTPHQTHQDIRMRAKSGNIYKFNNSQIMIENFRGDSGNLEICTFACLLRNLNRKSLKTFLQDMNSKKKLEIYDQILQSFFEENEGTTKSTNQVKSFNTTPQKRQD